MHHLLACARTKYSQSSYGIDKDEVGVRFMLLVHVSVPSVVIVSHLAILVAVVDGVGVQNNMKLAYHVTLAIP
jgi:hypothetical protein